ncbi:hypothetical protein ACFPER_11380 [Agromyces aurantiacus]|uniref:Nuclease n=1 Tax=Agromyces aurantiacus TaxID=165814 RepID=A0ABV9R6X9_9MICO|nr:hypothetical protein [Agromyces aurantiacus]MBM7504080.1 hypothetical protein [Agromyces aurantiacus]
MSTHQPHAAAESRTGLAMGMRGCVEGEACASDRPGHGLHPMQDRLSRIAASRWVDAVVTASATDGFVELVDLDGGAHRVWHHGALTGRLAVGDPVALHPVYGVLARGDDRVSVAAV